MITLPMPFQQLDLPLYEDDPFADGLPPGEDETDEADDAADDEEGF